MSQTDPTESDAGVDLPRIEAAVRQVAEAQGQKLGKIAQPLRAALTGKLVSPGVFDVASSMPRDEALRRIKLGSSRAD